MSSNRFVVPGDCISMSEENVTAGTGTYVLKDYIYSTVAGQVHQRDEDGKTIIEVIRKGNKVVVPEVNSVVLAKVTTMKRRYCKCAIWVIDGHHVKEPFKGMISKEDARDKEKDLPMNKSFRTGDLILARVKEIGAEQGYILTTTEKQLGVVFAHSNGGYPMMPLTFSEMICRETSAKEQRKVAMILAVTKPDDT